MAKKWTYILILTLKVVVRNWRPAKKSIKNNTLSKDEFDVKDYNLIETDVIVGLQLAGMDHVNPILYQFYDDMIDSVHANLVLHSAPSMTRLSYPLERINTHELATQRFGY